VAFFKAAASIKRIVLFSASFCVQPCEAATYQSYLKHSCNWRIASSARIASTRCPPESCGMVHVLSCSAKRCNEVWGHLTERGDWCLITAPYGNGRGCQRRASPQAGRPVENSFAVQAG
jgi:hypothetical protein